MANYVEDDEGDVWKELDDRGTWSTDVDGRDGHPLVLTTHELVDGYDLMPWGDGVFFYRDRLVERVPHNGYWVATQAGHSRLVADWFGGILLSIDEIHDREN